MQDQQNQKTVLVVDDEEDIVWSLNRFLSPEPSQFRVIAARSGEEALEILESRRVDLVITDIKMPGISGLELMTRIKNHYPQVSVIIMTAFPSGEYKREAILKGSLSFLEKPFDIYDLRRKVSEALEDKEQFKGTVSGITLSDVIQIKCMSGVRSTLMVKEGDRQGVIYFDQGQIVHALCEQLDGEEAFHEIMGFSNGILDTVKSLEIPERTIEKPYAALLMESARRMDENPPRREQPTEVLEPQEDRPGSAASVIPETKVTNPEPSADDFFTKLGEMTGYKSSLIVDPAGEILLTDPQRPDQKLAEAASLFSGIYSSARETAESFAFGSQPSVLISSRDGFVIIQPGTAGESREFCIISSYTRQGNHAMARIRTEKLLPMLSPFIV